MAILLAGSATALDTPRLPPVPLPRMTTQGVVLRECLYPDGLIDLLDWEITASFDFNAVNEDWDAPASYPPVPELTIWIAGWQQTVVVFGSRSRFVTVRDVLNQVHRAGERGLVRLAHSARRANRASSAGPGSLFSNAPAPDTPLITAPGRIWAGLTAPSDNAEEWVLALA